MSLVRRASQVIFLLLCPKPSSSRSHPLVVAKELLSSISQERSASVRRWNLGLSRWRGLPLPLVIGGKDRS